MSHIRKDIAESLKRISEDKELYCGTCKHINGVDIHGDATCIWKPCNSGMMACANYKRG